MSYEQGKAINASIKKKFQAFWNLSPVNYTEYKKLSISGYYKIKVPFVSTKSYEQFYPENEVKEEELEFITRNKNQGKFIAFEIDTKSMDNGKKKVYPNVTLY